MNIHNEGLQKEIEEILQPEEQERIAALFEKGEPIVQEIAYNLIIGNDKEVDRLTGEALRQGHEASKILDSGLIAAMAVVGEQFRDNIIFVPEVLIAARAMKAAMAHIDPILSASGVQPAGTIVIGTAKGDLHDIGKNLCVTMLRGAGFRVHDLGVDVKPDEFIEALQEHEAGMLGISSLLTTTLPNMGKTVEAIEEAGLRDKVKIMVGGAPLNQQFADELGADGYAKDAISCVELAQQLLQTPQADQAPKPTPTVRE